MKLSLPLLGKDLLVPCLAPSRARGTIWPILTYGNARLAAVICVVVVPGCMSGWRPPLEEVRPEPQARVEIGRSAYLKATRAGKWVYDRRELPAEPDAPGMRYSRQVAGSRTSEGTLVDQPLLELSRYLQQAGKPPDPTTDESRPTATGGVWLVVFFELEHPLDPLPDELTTSDSVTSYTTLRYFNQEGRPLAKGFVTRVAEIEGFEDVECPAGKFEQCLRVRVRLSVWFPLLFTVNWTTYFWLSPEVGEVRRVQQFTGWWLFFFWFGSAHEYQLRSYERPHEPMSSESPPTCWSRGVVLFDRGYPHVRIAGMAADLTTSQPAP